MSNQEVRKGEELPAVKLKQFLQENHLIENHFVENQESIEKVYASR